MSALLDLIRGRFVFLSLHLYRVTRISSPLVRFFHTVVPFAHVHCGAVELLILLFFPIISLVSYTNFQLALPVARWSSFTVIPCPFSNVPPFFFFPPPLLGIWPACFLLPYLFPCFFLIQCTMLLLWLFESRSNSVLLLPLRNQPPHSDLGCFAVSHKSFSFLYCRHSP